MAQATTIVEQTRAQIPALIDQEQRLKNHIAVLLGQSPGMLDEQLKPSFRLSTPSIQVALGVPAQVLRRRPDVTRAEQKLAAESARVGVAVAELNPKFSLGGSIGLESLSLSSLFEMASGVFAIGPRVSFNLLDGARHASSSRFRTRCKSRPSFNTKLQS